VAVSKVKKLIFFQIHVTPGRRLADSSGMTLND